MMPQTLPLSFETVLRAEIKKFEAQCTFKTAGHQGVPSVSHPDFGESGGDCSVDRLWEECLVEAGFTELELGLPTDHGHSRWTYAQYVMSHALAQAGWSHSRIGKTVGKTKNAVTGLLYRGTPWKTVADTRAGSWSQVDTETVLHLRDVTKLTWRGIGVAMGFSDVYCRLRYREAKNRKPEEPYVARV